MLAGSGYAALRFDFRGCGESEGEPGASSARSRSRYEERPVFLATRAEIDPERIGVVRAELRAASRYTRRGSTAGGSLHLLGGWGTARRNSASSTPRPGLEEVQRHDEGGKRASALESR